MLQPEMLAQEFVKLVFSNFFKVFNVRNQISVDSKWRGLGMKIMIVCLKNSFRSYSENTVGNFAIMFSLILATLLIGVASAVELSRLNSNKIKMQNQLDSVTLAATKLYITEGGSESEVFELMNSVGDKYSGQIKDTQCSWHRGTDSNGVEIKDGVMMSCSFKQDTWLPAFVG